MTDIELVIKLPKEDYKAIKNMQAIGDLTIPYVFDAIRNGTKLPKGHGDLIDKSDLIPDSDYEDGTFYAVSIGAINGIPTVVEADTSGGDTE